MKQNKEVTLLKSVYKTIFVIVFHVSYWMLIHYIAASSGLKLINFYSVIILFAVLIIPILHDRYEIVYLWHRKKLGKPVYYLLWGLLINTIYIGLGYMLYQGIRLIFE